MTRRKHQRMYAISAEGIGIIAGTMAYSRRAAIYCFAGNLVQWGRFKSAGYRTVECCVEVRTRGHRSRGLRRKKRR